MPPQASLRLPGVHILAPDATGPQYTRWRRAVKDALTEKGTWGHCDGTAPMPMPESGPNFFSPVVTSNPQPQLLEERKAWVKRDRDVKMDIFLSVGDDIKLEVFEVGPPLPPSAMTAQDMMEALDENFEGFNFENYHHVFCHFLNLHIDQYANLEDFNSEFEATLNDMLDHGYPLDNIQACSAYFSKLRCTQNPWVATKLKEWNDLTTTPLLADLMKECPPWLTIKPLSNKPAAPESYTEDLMGSQISEESESDEEKAEAPSDKSEVATVSSTSSNAHSRASSQASARSLEITVHASMEDLTDLASFPMPTQKLPKAPRTHPKRFSSKSSISQMSPLPAPLPAPIPAPINRPLPPLPKEAGSVSSRSASPVPKSSLDSIRTKPRGLSSRPQTPQLGQLRKQDQSQIHPALRSAPPTSAPSQPYTLEDSLILTVPTTPPMKSSLRPQSSHSPPKLAPPATPELNQRPQSSRAHGKPMTGLTPQSSNDSMSSWTQVRSTPLMTIESPSNSLPNVTLPVQGRNSPAPEYQDTILGTGTGLGVSNLSALNLSSSTPNVSLASTLVDPTVRSDSRMSNMSNSPPRSLMSKLSAELNDDDRKSRKRSWSVTRRLIPRKVEIREII